MARQHLGGGTLHDRHGPLVERMGAGDRTDGLGQAGALALEYLGRSQLRSQRHAGHAGHRREQGRREEGMHGLDAAVQVAGQQQRRVQDVVVERGRLVTVVARIQGRKDERSRRPIGRPAEQHRHRTTADQVPVGIREQGPPQRGMVMRVLDEQVRGELGHPAQDALVQRIVPVHVGRDFQAAGPQFVREVLQVFSPVLDEVLAQATQRLGVEEGLPAQGRIEVAGEQLERGPGQPREPRRLGGADLDRHRGIEHGQNAIEALHDAPPKRQDSCPFSMCGDRLRLAMRESHCGNYLSLLGAAPLHCGTFAL
jgi:hypothetical protein